MAKPHSKVAYRFSIRFSGSLLRLAFIQEDGTKRFLDIKNNCTRLYSIWIFSRIILRKYYDTINGHFPSERDNRRDKFQDVQIHSCSRDLRLLCRQDVWVFGEHRSSFEASESANQVIANISRVFNNAWRPIMKNSITIRSAIFKIWGWWWQE